MIACPRIYSWRASAPAVWLVTWLRALLSWRLSGEVLLPHERPTAGSRAQGVSRELVANGLAKHDWQNSDCLESGLVEFAFGTEITGDLLDQLLHLDQRIDQRNQR
jgi:hypothetical protein